MHRLAWLVSIVLGACGGEPEPPTIKVCASDIDCQDDASCRSGRCIDDGSLAEGAVCSKQRQCEEGLRCENQVCQGGCTTYYQTDTCIDDQWCKPLPGGEAACAATECGPQTSATCVGADSCIMLSARTGVCLEPCDYGFIGDDYQDTCLDSGGVNRACQAVGAGMSAVCLLAGAGDAPVVGEPGCNLVTNPCVEGAVCVDVVCRKLCRTSQAAPCPIGEQCLPLAAGSTLYTCRVP